MSAADDRSSRARPILLWLPPSALMLAGRILADDHLLAPAIAEFDRTAQEGAERIAAEGAQLASNAGFDAAPVTRVLVAPLPI